MKPRAPIRPDRRMPRKDLVESAPLHAIGDPARWEFDLQFRRGAASAQSYEPAFELGRRPPHQQAPTDHARGLYEGFVEDQLCNRIRRACLEDQKLPW